jgi:hypothetical protein
MEKRFPKESKSLACAFEVLSMRALSFLSDSDRRAYGNEKLDILLQHYGETKGSCKAIVDAEATRVEWAQLKQTVMEQLYPRDNFVTLYKIIYNFHKDSFPNIMKLAKIAMVLPLHTADCVSVQNNIHDIKRNRLESSTVNKLMMIQIEGPDIEHL